MRNLWIIGIFAIILSMCGKPEDIPNTLSKQEIDSLIRDGQFQEANRQIRKKLAYDTTLTDLQRWQIRFRQNLMHRKARDFTATENEVREYLQRYYPGLTDEQMRKWESSGALEMRRIDGKKRYFNYAAQNLFRIDSAARARKIAKDGPQKDPLDSICLENTAEILQASEGNAGTPVVPAEITYNYSLTVKAGAVPAGEVIRCWLPFPKEEHARQQQVKLHKTNVEDYVIAPQGSPHRTIYMEKTAKKGQPVTFSYSASYVSYGQWFAMQEYQAKPYNTGSDLYQQYTAEKPPHVVFTDRIKRLSEKIVQGATDPYTKVRRIYEWIDREIPWASALEYSTFWNIPEYVLKYRHGDCGMQTLLFITLARYNGIPAKWQSGWMMHPGEVNLHDWGEVYYPGLGWVPVDQSFSLQESKQRDLRYFYAHGIDSYRLIVNDNWSEEFFPAKIHPRSETVDFQRGEVEWRGGNLYFDQWTYNMDVSYSR